MDYSRETNTKGWGASGVGDADTNNNNNNNFMGIDAEEEHHVASKLSMYTLFIDEENQPIGLHHPDRGSVLFNVVRLTTHASVHATVGDGEEEEDENVTSAMIASQADADVDREEEDMDVDAMFTLEEVSPLLEDLVRVQHPDDQATEEWVAIGAHAPHVINMASNTSVGTDVDPAHAAEAEALLMQSAILDPTLCAHCGLAPHENKKCQGCLAIGYCSDTCQRKDWVQYHKAECKHFKKQASWRHCRPSNRPCPSNWSRAPFVHRCRHPHRASPIPTLAPQATPVAPTPAAKCGDSSESKTRMLVIYGGGNRRYGYARAGDGTSRIVDVSGDSDDNEDVPEMSSSLVSDDGVDATEMKEATEETRKMLAILTTGDVDSNVEVAAGYIGKRHGGGKGGARGTAMRRAMKLRPIVTRGNKGPRTSWGNFNRGGRLGGGRGGRGGGGGGALVPLRPRRAPLLSNRPRRLNARPYRGILNTLGRFNNRFGNYRYPNRRRPGWFTGRLAPWFFHWGLLGARALSFLPFGGNYAQLPCFNVLASPASVNRMRERLLFRYGNQINPTLTIVPDYNRGCFVWARIPSAYSPYSSYDTRY